MEGFVNIVLLCCGGWMAVLIFTLCMFTAGKWADENALKAQMRDGDLEDVPDDVADIL